MLYNMNGENAWFLILFIKCQVCRSITRVRLQVGWQEEHPIVVACGKCGTSLSGSVKIGQDRPGS